MGEVKRVFHKKMWILIAVAVLGNLCLFLYSELAGRSFTEMFFAAGQYQKLVERYENMSLEQAQERLGTEFGNIRKYAKILKQENFYAFLCKYPKTRFFQRNCTASGKMY